MSGYDLSSATSRDPYSTVGASGPSPNSLLDGVRSGAWLDRQEFPPLRYAVPAIIPEGLTVLAGAPKVGKSWAAFHIALSVSAGQDVFGCLPGTQRPVLYCALEDGHRRLQSRARSLLGADKPIPDDLDFLTELQPNLGLETVAEWLVRAADERPLIIVDTLARVMPRAHAGESAYERDYRAVSRFKQLADEYPGTAILLVHHTRKMAAEDFVDGVSGTAGITGSADTTVVLSRTRTESDGVLKVTGRDVWEAEYAVTKQDGGLWTLVGGSLERSQEAAAMARVKDGVGDRSAEIIDAVGTSDGIGPKTLAEQLDLDPKEAQVYLSRLSKSGRIAKLGRGVYGPANQQTNTPNTSVRGPLRLIDPDTPVGSVGSVGFPGQDDDPA